MKKEITVGQALTIAVSILVTVISAWVTLTNKVTRIEERNVIQDSEIYSLRLSNDKKFDKIDTKMDAMQEDIKNILYKLGEKENRK